MLVSFIVCTYNRVDILFQCILSLSNQTLENRYFEGPVIDIFSGTRIKNTFTQNNTGVV
jgi:hypothetical protein